MTQIEVDGVLYTQATPKAFPVCPACAHDEHGLPCVYGLCDCGHVIVKGAD